MLRMLQHPPIWICFAAHKHGDNVRIKCVYFGFRAVLIRAFDVLVWSCLKMVQMKLKSTYGQTNKHKHMFVKYKVWSADFFFISNKALLLIWALIFHHQSPPISTFPRKIYDGNQKGRPHSNNKHCIKELPLFFPTCANNSTSAL